MRKQIIIFLLTVLTLTVQGQVSKKVPEHIVNHKMNMDAPLPEPSFEIDSTTVRLHILNWNAVETSTNTACLTTMSFFPYMAENYTSSISNDGIAIIRFLQKGTSRANISINNAFSKEFYLYPGETADIYIAKLRKTNGRRIDIRYCYRIRSIICCTGGDPHTG